MGDCSEATDLTIVPQNIRADASNWSGLRPLGCRASLPTPTMREVLDMVETPTNRWPEPTMIVDDDAEPQGAGGLLVGYRRSMPSVAGPSPHLGNLGRSLSTGRTGSGDSFKLLELGWLVKPGVAPRPLRVR